MSNKLKGVLMILAIIVIMIVIALFFKLRKAPELNHPEDISADKELVQEVTQEVVQETVSEDSFPDVVIEAGDFSFAGIESVGEEWNLDNESVQKAFISYAKTLDPVIDYLYLGQHDTYLSCYYSDGTVTYEFKAYRDNDGNITFE